MLRKSCFLMSAVAIAASSLAQGASHGAAPNTLSPSERKAGWLLLFDGHSMAGWVDPRKMNPPGDAWTIENGCLKAQQHPAITEDLFTTRTFRDFELDFEWRISPKGNSGVKYRIQDHLFVQPEVPGSKEKFELRVARTFQNRVTSRPAKGQDYVIGFEYQMTDDSSNPDALTNPKHTAGALYDMVVPSSAAARPVGEFNQSRIVVRGAHVEHWLNGIKVVDSSLDSPAALEGIQTRWAKTPEVLRLMSTQPKKDCPISLQNHGDDAWFRSIKILPLAPQ